MGTLAVIEYFSNKNKSKRKMLYTPAISIIVPAYNEELNIVRTIASLLDQNYPDFEIICIDDGSTDSTWVKLQEAY